MLINCVACQNGVKLTDLPIEEISDYLERPDCFVRVAIFTIATVFTGSRA